MRRIVIQLNHLNYSMQNTFFLNLIDILFLAFQLLILARVIMSWVAPHPTNPLGRFLMEVTEPILAPFQKLIPNLGGFDFSPIAALVALQLLQNLAHQLI